MVSGELHVPVFFVLFGSLLLFGQTRSSWAFLVCRLCYFCWQICSEAPLDSQDILKNITRNDGGLCIWVFFLPAWFGTSPVVEKTLPIHSSAARLPFPSSEGTAHPAGPALHPKWTNGGAGLLLPDPACTARSTLVFPPLPSAVPVKRAMTPAKVHSRTLHTLPRLSQTPQGFL